MSIAIEMVKREVEKMNGMILDFTAVKCHAITTSEFFLEFLNNEGRIIRIDVNRGILDWDWDTIHNKSKELEKSKLQTQMVLSGQKREDILERAKALGIDISNITPE